MKTIGIIPSRYASTRFPGKGLSDICGKPMLWWVYRSLKNSKGIDEAYVATDDSRIADVCDNYNIPSVMTSDSCPTHLERLFEVSEKINADFYINVNGDEPLIESSAIEALIPNSDVNPKASYVANGMMVLKDPIDAFCKKQFSVKEICRCSMFYKICSRFCKTLNTTRIFGGY